MCKDGYEEYGYELKASIFGFTTSQVRMEDYTIPPKEVDAKHFCSIGCLKKYILDNIK